MLVGSVPHTLRQSCAYTTVAKRETRQQQYLCENQTKTTTQSNKLHKYAHPPFVCWRMLLNMDETSEKNDISMATKMVKLKNMFTVAAASSVGLTSSR